MLLLLNYKQDKGELFASKVMKYDKRRDLASKKEVGATKRRNDDTKNRATVGERKRKGVLNSKNTTLKQSGKKDTNGEKLSRNGVQSSKKELVSAPKHFKLHELIENRRSRTESDAAGLKTHHTSKRLNKKKQLSSIKGPTKTCTKPISTDFIDVSKQEDGRTQTRQLVARNLARKAENGLIGRDSSTESTASNCCTSAKRNIFETFKSTSSPVVSGSSDVDANVIDLNLPDSQEKNVRSFIRSFEVEMTRSGTAKRLNSSVAAVSNDSDLAKKGGILSGLDVDSMDIDFMDLTASDEENAQALNNNKTVRDVDKSERSLKLERRFSSCDKRHVAAEIEKLVATIGRKESSENTLNISDSVVRSKVSGTGELGARVDTKTPALGLVPKKYAPMFSKRKEVRVTSLRSELLGKVARIMCVQQQAAVSQAPVAHTDDESPSSELVTNVEDFIPGVICTLPVSIVQSRQVESSLSEESIGAVATASSSVHTLSAWRGHRRKKHKHKKTSSQSMKGRKDARKSRKIQEFQGKRKLRSVEATVSMPDVTKQKRIVAHRCSSVENKISTPFTKQRLTDKSDEDGASMCAYGVKTGAAAGKMNRIRLNEPVKLSIETFERGSRVGKFPLREKRRISTSLDDEMISKKSKPPNCASSPTKETMMCEDLKITSKSYTIPTECTISLKKVPEIVDEPTTVSYPSGDVESTVDSEPVTSSDSPMTTQPNMGKTCSPRSCDEGLNENFKESDASEKEVAFNKPDESCNNQKVDASCKNDVSWTSMSLSNKQEHVKAPSTTKEKRPPATKKLRKNPEVSDEKKKKETQEELVNNDVTSTDKPKERSCRNGDSSEIKSDSLIPDLCRLENAYASSKPETTNYQVENVVDQNEVTSLQVPLQPSNNNDLTNKGAEGVNKNTQLIKSCSGSISDEVLSKETSIQNIEATKSKPLSPKVEERAAKLEVKKSAKARTKDLQMMSHVHDNNTTEATKHAENDEAKLSSENIPKTSKKTKTSPSEQPTTRHNTGIEAFLSFCASREPLKKPSKTLIKPRTVDKTSEVNMSTPDIESKLPHPANSMTSTNFKFTRSVLEVDGNKVHDPTTGISVRSTAHDSQRTRITFPQEFFSDLYKIGDGVWVAPRSDAQTAQTEVENQNFMALVQAASIAREEESKVGGKSVEECVLTHHKKHANGHVSGCRCKDIKTSKVRSPLLSHSLNVSDCICRFFVMQKTNLKYMNNSYKCVCVLPDNIDIAVTVYRTRLVI